MCGRYTLAATEAELVEAFDVPVFGFDFAPSYNVAPSQPALVVAADRRGRRAGHLTWGLLPAWQDRPGSGFINARAESIAAKPSFREAFARRRCLIPADGFYEWKRAPGAKVPHWIHPVDHGLLAFAGIWESWSRFGAEPRHTFAIVTTDANGDVRDVHDRMPVLIRPDDFSEWLDPSVDARRVKRLLNPAPDGTLQTRVVSDRVNRPGENDPSLLDPVA